MADVHFNVLISVTIWLSEATPPITAPRTPPAVFSGGTGGALGTAGGPSVVLSVVLAMCQSCLPAATRLAQNVVSNINFDIGGLHSLEPPSVSAQSAETSHEIHVFTGGSIVTMKHGDPHRVESLATLDDKILAAGSASDVQEQVDKFVREDPSVHVYPERLDGDCLFPGFIEPHCHLLLSALVGHFFVNLDPLALKSNKRSDALSVLQNATPSGRWIAGYGYDPARMEDHADLSMAVLDGVSRTTPIFVINASGHIGYANSLAFSIAGITKTTPNPTGGTFVKDRGGNLTGVLLEVPAMAPFEAHLEPPPPQDFVEFAYGTLKKWSEAGCTTVFDAGIGLIRPGTDVDVRLLDSVTSQFPPVVRYTGAFTTATAIAVGAGVPPYKVNKDFLVRSIKVWADGSTQGFTAALREPYADSKGWGDLSLSDGEIRDTMAIWQKKGWQLLVHSNGDRSTDQALGAYDAILNHEPDPNPHIMHRIEHATVISLQQLRAAKFLNLGVSHLIGHVRYWGDAFRSWVLKDERAERIDPVKDDVDLGLVYSFHSDSPVSPVQPLMYACIAATRTMYQRPDTDVLGRDQRCSVIEALRGITTNAAKHVMLEDLIGSLESGKSADMVRLDQDPTMITDDHAADLGGIRVLETWLKGKMVYRRDTTTSH